MCNHVTTTKLSLRNHSRKHTKPFKCEECEAKFSEKAKLKMHKLDKHEGMKKYICPGPDCSYKSNDKGHFNHHLGMVHSDKRFHFKCERCEKSFGESGQLEKHQNVHDKTYQFPCTYCPKFFLIQQALTQHNLTHREKTFKCNGCEKSFKEKKKLTMHENTHTKEKMFPCQSCKFSAKQNSNLTVHIKKKHPNEK